MATMLEIVQKFYPNVRRVQDAKHPVMFDVTPPDIKGASSRKHQRCAIAVACKRKMRLDGAIVSKTTAYLIKGPLATRYLVASTARKELIAFDRGGKFQPGEYKLCKPQKKANAPGTRPSDYSGKRKRHNVSGVDNLVRADLVSV